MWQGTEGQGGLRTDANEFQAAQSSSFDLFKTGM